MLCCDTGPGVASEVELEEDVVLTLATLAGEDKHRVPGHRDREVAASGWALASLHHLFPALYFASSKGNCPHVIEPSIAIVAGKYPEFAVVDGGPVGRTGHRPLAHVGHQLPLTHRKL